jgi:DNA-binding NarL/FixJ family response regulator
VADRSSPGTARTPRSPGSWRALVVDEWALFRQGVRSVLAGVGVSVVDDVAGTPDALLRLWSTEPDLLVAGSPLQGSVADLVTRAKQAQPALAVLALLPVTEGGQFRSVLAAGADAVLTRTAGPAELEDAVRRLAAGERVLTAAAVLTGMMEGEAPGEPAAEIDAPSSDGDTSSAKKRTRRGTRGGRNRKKKAPAEAAAATAQTPVSTTELEPGAEPEAQTEPDAASEPNGQAEWEYVPMSEWEQDITER